MPRPIVGVGHSMGANNLVNLSIMHPRLLSTLVLIDPVMQSTPSAPPGSKQNFARSSSFRRDQWPSRNAAVNSMTKSKFYQAWDPRVLSRWIEFGLRDMPTFLYQDSGKSSDSDTDKPVTLATSKQQEVFTYLRPNFNGLDSGGKPIINRATHPDLDLAAEVSYPFYNPGPMKAFSNLPFLRPSVLYIFGGLSDLSNPESREQKMQRTGVGVGGSGGAVEGRVMEVLLQDAGHLVPMERVGDTAIACSEWLAKELERWRGCEDRWKRSWESKSKKERTMMTDEWRRRIGGDPRGTGQEKL